MEERLNLSEFAERISQIKTEISKVIVGQQYAVDLLLTAILSDGHVLIEGVPGVAKTLMAKLVSKLIDAKFTRVQFTPDLMPSDVLGTTVYNMQSGEFNFHQGPAFTDILLVDEINRAPAKTQAALFEVMEERQVSMDGKCYKFGDFYTVVATQNPVEQEGTYKLPEAQLDRFLMKITVTYPSIEDEMEILERHQNQDFDIKLENVTPIITIDEIIKFRKLSQQVYLEKSLIRYIAEIVAKTRDSKALFLGASPRASVSILKASKAYALIHGRDFVTPEDIKFVTPFILQHRIQLNAEAEMEGLSVLSVINRLIEKVEVPK